MPALAKPHRVAVLMPALTLDGIELVHVPEAALLVWMAVIEACQRHPSLAVYDPESTPIAPRNGHFAPSHALVGATPIDGFYASTRRDELIWLELGLVGGRSGVVRLHALGRDGKRHTFDAIGRRLGDQIDQAINAWLTARELGSLPKRFEAIAVEELVAVARVVGPVLVEAARLPPTAGAEGDEGGDDDDDDDDDDVDEDGDGGDGSSPDGDEGYEGDGDDDVDDPDDDRDGSDDDDDDDEDADADDDGVAETRHAMPTFADDASDQPTKQGGATKRATPAFADDPVPPTKHAMPSFSTLLEATSDQRPVARLARLTAQRLPLALRIPALRVLALALGEPLDDLILAADPEHPQALLATMPAGEDDYVRLRRAIAAAPGWARPYAALVGGFGKEVTGAPNALETLAGAGLAVMGRPGNMSILDAASDALDEVGCIDEGIRLLERSIALHDTWGAHISLMNVVRHSDRTGAYLAAAERAGAHGCPMDAFWYPDQIQIDLWISESLLHAGRLDEAIALRANRLEGRRATWPRHTRILDHWRKDPRFVAWSYAREGYFRGDEARAVEAFGRIEPGDDVDTALFLDALVAMGRESEVALAWAQFGLGRGHDGPVARLAAARGMLVAGDWRPGMEELWRCELAEPGRDQQVGIARGGLLLSIAPIEIAEVALGDRVAIGAPTLARRMARDIADFMPAAAKSGLVARALANSGRAIDFDPAWLAGFAPNTRSKKALDALFAQLGSLKGDPEDQLARGDRLIDRWLEVAFTEASEADPQALVQAAAYAAAQALARYLAATTAAPNAIAGALRTVASEALELVRTHRAALADKDARAMLATLEPVLRRVDRWIGSMWLGTVERCCAIDERARGDVGGFAKDLPTVAARILGPEEAAVLAASVARLVASKPDGWASAVGTQAERLALHTGFVGVEEWADAIVAQLADRAIDLDDAIDGLHTACFLAQGASAKPALHAARVLLGAGRAPAAIAVLSAGLGAATAMERDAGLASLADDWKKSGTDTPLAFDKLALGMFEALQKGTPARAEKLGRFAVALDPTNAEAHRNLGLALAQQGKVTDALVHLVRATPEQATQILSGVLYQSGKVPEAMAVLDYASRWYVRADQWLTYGGIAYAAMDNPRTVRAYRLAFQLDPDAFDASQLNAYAGVLDEVGDYATCEKIAKLLFAAAKGDKMWETCAWNHEACALIGAGKFTRAIELAEQAVAKNPLPDNTEPFAATLARAQAKQMPVPPAAPPIPGAYEEGSVFAQLAAGEHAAAAARATAKDWRTRRGALAAARFRFTSENRVAVTARARAAASAVMAQTIGATERDAVAARALALTIREQAYFARDPVVMLGDRMTRGAFYQEFRARGGVVLGEEVVPVVAFVDREVVPGAKVARASDYIALLRDLAALTPREALALFGLDAEGYVEVSKAWAAAMDKDPTIAPLIAAGLAATK